MKTDSWSGCCLFVGQTLEITPYPEGYILLNYTWIFPSVTAAFTQAPLFTFSSHIQENKYKHTWCLLLMCDFIPELKIILWSILFLILIKQFISSVRPFPGPGGLEPIRAKHKHELEATGELLLMTPMHQKLRRSIDQSISRKYQRDVSVTSPPRFNFKLIEYLICTVGLRG